MNIMFPPRPASKIHPSQLGSYDATGEWVAQRKFNGTRNLIHVTPHREVKLFTRHGTPHKQYVLTNSMREQILNLKLKVGSEYWLDGELLHAKTKTSAYKSRIVLYDVLFAGQYLDARGITQLTRLEYLHDLCGNPRELEPNLGIALRVSDDLWVAETFEKDFVGEYERYLDHPEVEGLVLRKRLSSLFHNSCGYKPYEVSWVIRCRKPSKIYSY
jgi:hypothetical protein